MSKRVLVIDDDLMIRTLVEEYLKAFGFEVEGVEDGATGLNSANNSGFDLIILDMQMPDMTGLQVLEKLKAVGKTKDLPVILLSANSDAQALSTPGALANIYLDKPFTVQKLMDAIKSLIKE